MKGHWLFVLGAVCGAGAVMLPRVAAHLHAITDYALQGNGLRSGGARVHTETRFAFTAHAPMEQVAPLFGADKERDWAPGWDPQFIHPLPETDVGGMVFTVAHDHLKSVWVNTEFDAKNGRVQYVYVIPDVLVTVIKLGMKVEGTETRVDVEYDRTALSANGDAHVQHRAKQDQEAGAVWESQINGYLKTHPFS
jgi:hypothetical protein